MGVSYVKFCPRCQTTTAVDSALCPNCGHHFRTHFQPKMSEKTVAMTSIPEAQRLQAGPSPLQEFSQEYRPRLRPRLILIGTAFLAVLGLLYGIHTRHTQQSIPAPKAAFQPYDIVTKGSSPSDSVPLAPHSITDLQQWAATESHQKASDDASNSDSPAHIELYRTKHIVLIPPGTPGRVLLEREQWRQIQIVDGIYKGTTGFVSGGDVKRSESMTQETADAPR